MKTERAMLRDFFARPADAVLADPEFVTAHEALLDALEDGSLRAAEPSDGGAWQVNAWVKTAIVLGFRGSPIEPIDWGTQFLDKRAYPPRAFTLDDGVRLVPGGTAVRRGSHLGKGVIVMPPAYVNVGAFVDCDTMIDSHALVGSCAQVGKRVHLSAGAQVGGVLEPAGASPVIVEDDAFLGGLVGVFEGVRIGPRAVLASGVVLTASTKIHDLVNERAVTGEVPSGAVVIPGSRPASGDYARQNGLTLATPVIVKYRDDRTSAAVALEDALR